MPASDAVSKRRLAHLQALCHAGLAGGDFVPALLEALHGLVPSVRNLFDRTDEQGRLLHYYVEGPVDTAIAQLYFERFHNRREAQCMPAFASLACAPGGVRGAQALMTPAFFASELYHEIWKPQGLHSRLEAVVRDAQGRLLGSLVLYRGPGDAPFRAEDERLLAALLPWIARGLQPQGSGAGADGAERFVPAPELAETLLLDHQGRLLSATEGAPRLLLLADEGLTLAALAEGASGMQAAVDRLFGRWLAPRGTQATQPAIRADSLTLINAHGRFVAEARSLQALGGRPGEAMLQVSLRRLEPQSVALQRALRRLPLTPSQLGVCAALYAGSSASDIAQSKGVAPSTVIDHTRKIYRALNVCGAAELRQRVQAELDRERV